MKLIKTPIRGVTVIEPRILSDSRGSFLRTYCRQSLLDEGIDFSAIQGNLSGNVARGTLRGLHYQIAPAPEAKLIQCVRGSIYDLTVDMDPESSTYLSCFGVELSAENRKSVYVPPLTAHGYLALTEGAEASYLTSAPYTPECERGVRYDDPAFHFDLPVEVAVISEKDRQWPNIK